MSFHLLKYLTFIIKKYYWEKTLINERRQNNNKVISEPDNLNKLQTQNQIKDILKKIMSAFEGKTCSS